MTAHGGDVWGVAEELGIPASELLDFSANINPRGLPPRAAARLARDAADPKLLSFYPDRSGRRLREAIARQLSIDAQSIVIGPGAEALLAPIFRCVQPRRALVPIPAFSEYRRVCEQLGVEFEPRPLEANSYDLVLLNNPHNPSGKLLTADEVRRAWHAASANGATMLLDEAFIDYAPHASLVREAAAQPGLIVLRSLTKFYGCPALRVGYAVALPETIQRIGRELPTWPITQLAIDALAEAVEDREYAAASIRENAIERESLCAALTGLGLIAFFSEANFLLLELQPMMPPASELRARLIAKHRILIRNCDSYEGLTPGRFIRVAVRSAEDNRRLIHALAEELTLP